MTALFVEFQEFRKILYVCPCCEEIGRVSDLRLSAKGKVAKTWLDDYEKKCLVMGKKEETFAEKGAKLRELAVKKGRKAAEIAVKKAISPSLKALNLDPFDVKPVLNPIDFIAFNGMNKKEKVSDVILLSNKVNNPQLNAIRKQVNVAIEREKYDWQVARIDASGKIGME